MPATAGDLDSRSVAELTMAVFGESMTLDELFVRVPLAGAGPAATQVACDATWVGSAGYERHQDSALFARGLGEHGVECLIDVRELPISRRRGYAKTALAGALACEGIEYVHVKALGNPKPYRDLYKTGHVEEGRRAYRELLLAERLDVVESIVPLLREKRCVLMCLEHDEATCHRSVIFEALQAELGVPLVVAQLS